VSAANVEILLARLYADAQLRMQFLRDAAAVARAAGLDDAEVAAMQAIDRVGLELAAESYARKRAKSGR
jgi:hypothetical protein